MFRVIKSNWLCRMNKEHFLSMFLLMLLAAVHLIDIFQGVHRVSNGLLAVVAQVKLDRCPEKCLNKCSASKCCIRLRILFRVFLQSAIPQFDRFNVYSGQSVVPSFCCVLNNAGCKITRKSLS